jgi:oligopeptidase B
MAGHLLRVPYVTSVNLVRNILLRQLNPPIAPRRPQQQDVHGITISDDWAWLRDPAYPEIEDPQVMAYLTAENQWFEDAMAPHQPLVKTLFDEMKGRLKADDASVPQRDGDWLYWWAYPAGGQYRQWWRKPVAGGPDQLLLDENVEAAGKDYFRLGALTVSPDGALLAWSSDSDGAERYTVQFRALAGGKAPTTTIAGTIGQLIFSACGQFLFYGLVDEQWRCRTIKRHKLGGRGPAKKDIIVYDEPDIGFSAGISRSQDRRWLIIATGDHDTSEAWLIPADAPETMPRLVSPRQKGRLYALDAGQDNLWILTNDEHPNFRLAKADPWAADAWQTVLAGSDHTYLRGLTAFREHLLLQARVDGLDQLILRDRKGTQHSIAFPEASYTASPGSNPEYAPDHYRIGYASMVTPATVYDYDPATRTLLSRKVQDIPSGYDPARYRTERLSLTARDGTTIPVSLVCPHDFPKDGSGKLLLYGYGAYGIAIPPGFSTTRLSLLDRGWAYAIAHIRGGDDLGHAWYLAGKQAKRWNTFYDFIDVAKGLIGDGWTSAGKLAIHGGSAGGELMGVAANLAPELWGAVVADVPFVDVLNTMLDASLPLTPGEWPEWGNPSADKAAFELIQSYSPYDNVSAQAYPPMLITGGLNDPRVTYWEPAKWTAKLRATKTDNNPLLLKINMGAGHGGKSGRYDSLYEMAEAYAFVLTAVA